MSFSNEVKKELLSVPIKKNCCKKAFLFGLLYNAQADKTGCGSIEYNMPEAAETALELLGSSAEPRIKENVRAGRRYYTLSFASKALSGFLYKIENQADVVSAAAFRCEGCRSAFARGVLASGVSVNDPHKGYHLEIALDANNERRIASLFDYLSQCGFEPKIHKREKRVSLYFKSNTQISDLLSFSGAMRSSFEFANVCIERDIRNNENRATNCVAKNISKSVGATRKQIEAINKLIECHKYESLSAELEQTARLRLENEDISLSELARLHEPPISKSGLNHRLEKICEIALDCE